MRLRFTLSILFVFLILLLFSSCTKEPAVKLSFYFMEVCPGCESYEMAEELQGRLVTITKSRGYTGRSWNLGHDDDKGSAALVEDLEGLGLPDLIYAVPLLIVGDEYYVGYEDIDKKLQELYDAIKN